MKHRNEWLPWVATAVGLLGLVGLASAQPNSNEALSALPSERNIQHDRTSREVRREGNERAATKRPITDDGRSADVPLARQLVLVRKGTSEGPFQVELFNERGDVLQSAQWNGTSATRKTIDLDGLSTGRYALRISGAGRSEVVRFRQD